MIPLFTSGVVSGARRRTVAAGGEGPLAVFVLQRVSTVFTGGGVIEWNDITYQTGFSTPLALSSGIITSVDAPTGATRGIFNLSTGNGAADSSNYYDCVIRVNTNGLSSKIAFHSAYYSRNMVTVVTNVSSGDTIDAAMNTGRVGISNVFTGAFY